MARKKGHDPARHVILAPRSGDENVTKPPSTAVKKVTMPSNSAFRRSAFLSLAIAAFLSACGGDSTAPNGPAEVVVAAVDTLRSIGATATLTAVVRNANHEAITGVAVSWTSSNAAMATVDPTTGLATAVANGTVTITARAGAVTGSTMVTILQAPVSVKIVPPTD